MDKQVVQFCNFVLNHVQPKQLGVVNSLLGISKVSNKNIPERKIIMKAVHKIADEKMLISSRT